MITKIERFIKCCKLLIFSVKMAERQLTALVVDDEIDIGRLLVEILSMKSVIAEYVLTTQEGIDILGKNRYDLAFIDLNQKPTGVDVYRIAHSKGIEVYIMTGGASENLLTEAKKEAGNHLIMKPFKAQEILDILEQYSQRQQPQS